MNDRYNRAETSFERRRSSLTLRRTRNSLPWSIARAHSRAHLLCGNDTSTIQLAFRSGIVAVGCGIRILKQRVKQPPKEIQYECKANIRRKHHDTTRETALHRQSPHEGRARPGRVPNLRWPNPRQTGLPLAIGKATVIESRLKRAHSKEQQG